MEEKIWNYDCPQYVDFSQPQPLNDGADVWFELKSSEDLPEATSENNCASVPMSEPENDDTNVATCMSDPEKSGTSVPMSAPKNDSAGVPMSAPKKHSAGVPMSAPKKHSAGVPMSAPKNQSAGVPMSAPKNHSASVPMSAPKNLRTDISTFTKKEPNVKDENVGNVVKKPKLTYSAKKVLSSEEKEMGEIAGFKKQLAMKRKMAQESLKQAKKSTGYKPIESLIKPTIPMDFSFQTDSRIKKQNAPSIKETLPSQFPRMLRKHQSGSDLNLPRSLTKPQPFKLSSNKRSLSDLKRKSQEKFETMAEQVTAFHKKTPERFRKVPKSKEEKKFVPRLTQAVTPMLSTRSRTRSLNIPSQEQLEDQQVKDMKKHQFKAHRVNTNVLQNPNLGVPKVPVRPTTKPKEFNLHPGKRKVEQTESIEEKPQFHANPPPTKIFKHTVGLKPVKVIPVTIPQSPAFALKNRVRLPVDIPDEKDNLVTVIKSHPVPHVGIPFQPKVSHNHTVPEPFTFEERNKYIQEKKEEKVKQLLEEEKKMRDFQAQPIPWMDTPTGLPNKQMKEVTKPDPFLLSVDVRGAKKAEEWSHQVEEELTLQRKAKSFQARPATVIKKEPFVPERSYKPLTDVSEFDLNTDRRAVEREMFEQHKKAREAELESAYRLQTKRNEEEERVVVAKLRAAMVHKSNPVKKYCPVHLQENNKPLTQPVSPRFSQRLRSKVRM